jgi:copper homeostasis protein
MARLVRAAQGMQVVLHRAFDLCPDPMAALEQAVALGVTRILTSGGQARAEDGLPRIARLIAQAAGRIAILPGSGITPANVGRFLAVGAHEIHASCAGTRAEDPQVAAMGFGPAEVRQTEAARVAALKAAIAAAHQA